MPKGICLFSTVNRAKKSSKTPFAVWKNDSLMWLESCEKETLGSHTRELEKRRSIFLQLIKPTLDSTWRTLFGCVLQIWGWKHNTNRLSWLCGYVFFVYLGVFEDKKSDIWERIYFHPKCQLHIHSQTFIKTKTHFWFRHHHRYFPHADKLKWSFPPCNCLYLRSYKIP